jgi:hypothetical protein
MLLSKIIFGALMNLKEAITQFTVLDNFGKTVILYQHSDPAKLILVVNLRQIHVTPNFSIRTITNLLTFSQLFTLIKWSHYIMHGIR